MTENNPDFQLALAFIKTHPDDAAGMLETLPPGDVIGWFPALSQSQAGSMLIRMMPSHAATLCSMMQTQFSVELLSNANIDRIVAILRFINGSQRESILTALPLETSATCRLLLGYTQDSVGAWMNPQIIMLPAESSAAETLARLASESININSGIIHIVDHDLKLLGIVEIAALLHASGGKPVLELADRTHASISGRASLTSVQHHPGWKQRDILTIVNRHHQPIGILRHADLRKGLERGGRDEADAGEAPLPVSLYRTYGGVLIALLNVLNDISGGFRKP